MNEKIMDQLKNSLVAHKRKLWSMVMLVALFASFSAGAHAMFRVNGVVTGVGDNSITVANFFRTQTVDLTGAPVNILTIKPGDKVKVEKTCRAMFFLFG